MRFDEIRQVQRARQTRRPAPTIKTSASSCSRWIVICLDSSRAARAFF